MDAYGICLVWSGKFKPDKTDEAARWWREKGAPDLLAEPWTKSLHAYAGQFRLAGEYDLEVWQEIENYAALDRMDEWYAENPERARKKDGLWRQSVAFFDWGPSRLVGDWPESGLLPE